jgi:hypothetical protein
MKKYEYMVISIMKFSSYKIQEELNSYGREGWELIHVESNYYFFKREISSKEFNEN